jgi:hypothetical protein
MPFAAGRSRAASGSTSDRFGIQDSALAIVAALSVRTIRTVRALAILSALVVRTIGAFHAFRPFPTLSALAPRRPVGIRPFAIRSILFGSTVEPAQLLDLATQLVDLPLQAFWIRPLSPLEGLGLRTRHGSAFDAQAHLAVQFRIESRRFHPELAGPIDLAFPPRLDGLEA